MWRFDKREQSTGTLDQSAHGIGVALPVAGKLPVLNLWRGQMDAEHVRNLAAPVLAVIAWRNLLRALRKWAISSLRNSSTGWA